MQILVHEGVLQRLNMIFIKLKRGLKAYFKLKKCFEHHKPKIKTILHVFDHTVKPVLLHGSEIWGIFDAKKLNKLKDSYFNKNL